jgi:hypothetical protein
MKRGQGTFVSNSSTPQLERSRLLRDVAARALRDAFRHGLTADELIGEIRTEANANARSHSEETPEA